MSGIFEIVGDMFRNMIAIVIFLILLGLIGVGVAGVYGLLYVATGGGR